MTRDALFGLLKDNMDIFIDESGTFSAPGGESPRVSCLAALAVPESQTARMGARIRRLMPRLGISGELKGRGLGETQVSKIVTTLEDHDVILVVCLVDLAFETESEIDGHKAGQAAHIRQLPGDMNPTLLAELEVIADRVAGLPNQLYLQMLMLSELVFNVVQSSLLHYSHSCPAALGAFRWTIDAKDKTRTEYESLWQGIVKPLLQGRALETPVIQLKGGNYTHFHRFENEILQEAPEYLRDRAKVLPGGFQSFDIKQVMDEHMEFVDSKECMGLQIADVLANAFRRACNGRLRRKGWRNLGRLMNKSVHHGDALRVITLRDNPPGRIDVPYSDFLVECEQKSRSRFGPTSG